MNARRSGCSNIIRTSGRQLEVLTTGGTLDKIYFDAKGGYKIGQPMVRSILRNASWKSLPLVTELMRKDSLDIGESDRQSIRDAVEASGAQAIVITHGTDSLTDTARVLSEIRGKTIVLTGALRPARFADSDASFNVGLAIGVALWAPWGIYVAANDCVFPAELVRKNFKLNRFELIESKESGHGDRR